MLGTVFHYSVTEPEGDHARCFEHRNRIIAMHERMGYRRGGAYNGHFCHHGGWWLSYEGPNQASGNTWANLNLEAWCFLGTVGTVWTPEARRTAYELTLRNPRDRIHPHSDFFPTSCCGDEGRAWIRAGALPPAVIDYPIGEDSMIYVDAQAGVGLHMQGNVIAAEFSGARNEYGIPLDAIAYSDETGIRIRVVSPLLIAKFRKADELAMSAPVVGGGGGVSAEQIRQAVRAELDRTKLGV